MKTTQCSLPQLRCVKGANTFPGQNQFLTLEFLIRPIYSGLLMTLNQTTRRRLLETSRRSSTCNTTPVLKINFFYILFFFLLDLFFNFAFVNAWPTCSLKHTITYSHLTLSKCVFGRMPFSIALIHMS
jgi:hypothetical protein